MRFDLGLMRGVAPGVVLAGMMMAGGTGLAQAKSGTMPDAQVEANVLKALAGAPELADQAITTTTVYGTVTLTGTVRDEQLRVTAETLASKAAGVQKVVDELTLGDPAQAAAAGAQAAPAGQAGVDSNPNLQSDGTMAPAVPSAASEPGAISPPAPPAEAGDAGGAGEPQQPMQGSVGANGQPGYGQPAYGQGGYGQQTPPARAPYNGSGYGAPSGPPAGYAQGQAAPPPYGAQVGGQAVSVPSGSMLRIRINQGLDSKHAQPGARFDGTVLNDVVADGQVAIPRGAAVQGTVVDAKASGALKGRAELTLQLNSVILAGKSYPIVSDTWSNVGPDKTIRTVNNSVGLGALGAIIGAVAGGGPGAAIGAGAGVAAGLGTSAASPNGQAWVPAEAILTFHLAQAAPLTTVSQAEMDRLSYGAGPAYGQQRLVRRPPPPPYPGYYGGYYGPRYYPYPY